MSGSAVDEIASQGYAVLRGLLPSEIVSRARDAVLDFVGANRYDPESWQDAGGRCPRGFVPLWDHQALWDIRQSPALYEVLSALLGTEDLWVTFDRCHFKPPYVPGGAGTATALCHFGHWDEPHGRWPNMPFQAAVSLTDTPPEQGAFVCAPELYRIAVEHGMNAAGERQASGVFELRQIGTQAGEVTIWDKRLYHGNGPNLGSRPRLAFYVSMHATGDDLVRQERQLAWQEGAWLYGDWLTDRTHRRPVGEAPAVLTDLGQRLRG
jgi:hypothetical protein